MRKEDNSPMKSVDLESLIDYVEGSASEATRQLVDQYLDENEDDRMVVDGIRTYYEKYGMDRESMLAYLQQSRNTALLEFKERTAKSRSMPQWIGWAAAVVLICLGIGGYFLAQESSSYQSTVISYLSDSYPAPSFLSNENTESWMDAYQTGDYQQAAALLENIIPQQQDNTSLLYYAGLSHLYQHPPQPEPAISYLSQINEGALVPQAHWFLALAYLLHEQTEKAESILNQIVEAQTYHHEAAAELLAQISQE